MIEAVIHINYNNKQYAGNDDFMDTPIPFHDDYNWIKVLTRYDTRDDIEIGKLVVVDGERFTCVDYHVPGLDASRKAKILRIMADWLESGK